MAIAHNGTLGQSHTNATTPATLTTGAAVPVNSKVIVLISYFSSTQTVSTVTVGGTAATKDKQALNGSDKFEIWSVEKAAGMVISSSISVAMTGSTGLGGILIGATSFTGILTTGYLDTTSSSNSTATAWSSGAATNVTTEALFIGGAGTEDITAGTASTATSGAEIHDLYNATTQQGFSTAFRIETTVGSRNVGGNWSNANSTANTGALAIYGSATGGAAVTVKKLAAMGVG